jgi:6-methylsalicylate decarboxylase
MTGPVDIHHHALPPDYLRECRDEILGPAADLEHVLEWTPERSLEELDAAGCARAILSVSAPGVWFGDERQTIRLARDCNDYLADLKRRHPDRFGFFATLPLPDARATVAEIVRAFDELDADGVCMMTSYDRRWLGDPSLQPVFAELQRRAAAVFVHPVIPPPCRGLMATIPDALGEFAFDTARTIMSLLFGGVLSRSPDIRFAFSHGGGAMIMLLDRLAAFPTLRPSAAAAVPDGVLAALGRQFYDTGSMGQPACFAALREMPGAAQLVFATDYPYRPVALALAALDRAGVTDAERALIDVTNPRRLLGET